jgi:phosphoglycolate phosphatase-like HAD superfamily hydrolase
MIKSVIFDFDDTLIDNRDLDYQGFVIPCSQLHMAIPQKKEITHLRKNGFLAKDIVKHIKKQTKTRFSVEDFLLLRASFLQSSKSISLLSLRNKTINVFSYLRRRNVKCFLCTVRKDKKVILNFLKQHNLEKIFQEVYTTKDTGCDLDNTNSQNRILIKNSLIYKIIKKYNLILNEIVFVGNSEDDYKSAMQTNVNFILFINSYTKQPNIENVIHVNNMSSLQKKLSIFRSN